VLPCVRLSVQVCVLLAQCQTYGQTFNQSLVDDVVLVAGELIIFRKSTGHGQGHVFDQVIAACGGIYSDACASKNCVVVVGFSFFFHFI